MADDLAQTRREIAARIDLFEQADTALLSSPRCQHRRPGRGNVI